MGRAATKGNKDCTWWNSKNAINMYDLIGSLLGSVCDGPKKDLGLYRNIK